VAVDGYSESGSWLLVHALGYMLLYLLSAGSAGLGRLALYEVESREPFAVVPACRVLSLPYRRSAILARLGGVMPVQVESGVAGSNVADSLSVVTSLRHAPACRYQ